MKKILPILVIVLVLGGAYFLYSKKTDEVMEKDAMEKEMMMDEKMEEGKDKESFTGDIKTLIAKNIPMMCSFDVEGYKYNAWIKGGKVKSEYITPQGSGTVIVDGSCMYTWMDGETQGMEICFDPADGDIWDQSEDLPSGDLPSEYYCVPSLILDSVFDLPEDVEFMGLDMMMQMQGLEDYMQQ